MGASGMPVRDTGLTSWSDGFVAYVDFAVFTLLIIIWKEVP
jgi:hypothetical protein